MRVLLISECFSFDEMSSYILKYAGDVTERAAAELSLTYLGRKYRRDYVNWGRRRRFK